MKSCLRRDGVRIRPDQPQPTTPQPIGKLSMSVVRLEGSQIEGGHPRNMGGATPRGLGEMCCEALSPSWSSSPLVAWIFRSVLSHTTSMRREISKEPVSTEGESSQRPRPDRPLERKNGGKVSSSPQSLSLLLRWNPPKD
jgi:hypothetical protein